MKNFLVALDRGVIRIITFMNVLATAWIFAMIMFVVLDVAGRVFFNSPLTGTPEIVKVSNPAITFLQIAYVLWMGAHVRTTILLDRISSRKVAFIDILACLMGVAVFSLNFYAGWSLTTTAWSVGEYEGEGALRVPTTPVRIIIEIGSFFMVYLFCRMIVQHLGTLIKGTQKR